MAELKVDTAAAAAYESALVPGLFGPWATKAISWATIAEGNDVLDVACGTGVGTRAAALKSGSSGRVVGIDLDTGMIAVAETASANDGGARIEWRCGSAQALPFEDQSFDVALCLQGLQFFPDRILALQEMRRVLRADGRILATVWRDLGYCKGHQAIVEALERRGIDATAGRKPFSLDEQLLRHAAERAGLRQINIRAERGAARFASAEAFIDAIARGAPSSRHALAKVPTEDWPVFVAEVSAALKPWLTGAGLGFPMESHVMAARP